MPWLKLRLRTGKDTAESWSDALEECGAISVSLEDAGDEPLLACALEETPLWSQMWVTALFPSETKSADVLAQLAQILRLPAKPEYEAEILADQDWERAWMDRFQPMHFGGDLWVVPSWLAAPQPGAVNIVLDPGLAFGTGTHATTALCLAWLAQHPPLDQEVIDFGCGSGILAIAALKLGARHAIGVDVDPRALEVSLENAEHNAVTGRLTLGLPSSLPTTVQADLVIANILAQPLIQLAVSLMRLVKPGGTLILSGMLENQTSEVSRHYLENFVFERQVHDQWAMLVGKRKKAGV
jgi:ribosomal protein L11 methyltransferase